jgi:hypothetical protein
MNIAIISYSHTGNNHVLADRVARELSAKHIKILEHKFKSMGSIILDMIFNRTPQTQPTSEIIDQHDLILFFGPVWMGYVASPLRPYLKYLKTNPHRYGFFSISGGADNKNLKLAGDITKRAGARPVIFLDQHIADLLVSNSKPTRKDTSDYRLCEEDVIKLSNNIIKLVENIIA